MDPNALMGMIFTLVMILMVGGIILLYPVSRHLGRLIEMKTRATEGAQRERTPEPEALQLQELIRDLQAEVGRLSERQEFFEKLLADPTRKPAEKLPR